MKCGLVWDTTAEHVFCLRCTHLIYHFPINIVFIYAYNIINYTVNTILMGLAEFLFNSYDYDCLLN